MLRMIANVFRRRPPAPRCQEGKHRVKIVTPGLTGVIVRCVDCGIEFDKMFGDNAPPER